MKNLNLRISDDLYWAFKGLQSKFKVKKNEDILRLLVEKELDNGKRTKTV
jgi:hypothetical protein